MQVTGHSKTPIPSPTTSKGVNSVTSGKLKVRFDNGNIIMDVIVF